MKQHDIITALRARGRSDALAQAAADEIERLRLPIYAERARCRLIVQMHQIRSGVEQTGSRTVGRFDMAMLARIDDGSDYAHLLDPTHEPMRSAEASIFDADGKLKPDQKFDARLSVAVGQAVNSALDGFIITEKVREDDAKAKWQAERNRDVKQRMDAMPIAEKVQPVVLMGDEAKALAKIKPREKE